MPLTPGNSSKTISKNISELHTGKTYAHTAAKFGKERAQKQSIAIALSESRKGRAFGGPVGSNPALPQMMMPPPSPPGAGAPMQAPPMGVAPGMAPMMPPGQINSSVAPAGLAPGAQMPQSLGAMSGQMAQALKRGGTPKRAFGGAGLVKTPAMSTPWQEKQEARNMTRGPILSAVPGRTDAHKTHVPSGSYVIPADIVSGRGEGNTIAGAGALQHMFRMGPYGTGTPKIAHGAGAPHPPKLGKMLASGGGKEGGQHMGTPVRVNLAGGEVVIPPEHILETLHRLHPGKKFTLKQCHEILDKWVVDERKRLRKTLARLPGPVKE